MFGRVKTGTPHEGGVCFYEGRHYAVKVSLSGDQPDLRKPLRADGEGFVHDRGAPNHNVSYGTQIVDLEVAP